MLIYDGLHYDALAVAAFDGAPEELDITVLQVGLGLGQKLGLSLRQACAEALVL
jgi:ubiquitin thioesterase OTU1